ncbi:MAG: DNA mismatch repair endonuclease MutL [Clostridia bacterium]|nr:DNA mismatch repair endonuclease MutL [Clostridia bacterium]
MKTKHLERVDKTMGNIVLLDDLTINKIAAGEVIERPASVVKELMENSIDAGATSVTAEIKNGGITYIRITDNGKGILPDDMEIAFERHATSKIRSAKDLEIVKSMGFRGEALASIAAIAHVELTSRTHDSELGYKIIVEGGKIISKEVVGCPRGTTIVVENLFFNTPVRYKFLKKDFTETGYIEDTVTRIALVNPNIAIKLINLGKNIIQTTGNGSVKDVVYSIYGKDIAENIINVNYQYEDMSIKGCIGKPSIARSNRSNQLFFVNNRFVKDKTLTSAAEQAFKGMVTIGKYGFLILNIDIDPHKIDVNVHPAKLEIRFQEENKIFKLVYHAIKEALLQEDYLGRNKKYEEIAEDSNVVKGGFFDNKNDQEIDEENSYKVTSELKTIGINNENKIKTIEQNNIVFNRSGNLIEDLYNDKIISSMINEKKNQSNFEEDKELENQKNEKIEIEKNIKNETNSENTENKDDNKIDYDTSFEEMYRKTFGKSPINNINKIEENKEEYEQSEENVQVETAENVSLFENKTVYNSIKYKFVGIAFSTYIIIEIDNELYIIDQHAAHERILYEKIKQNYYNDENKDSQLMLLPDIITLTHKEMDIARDNFDLFKKAGFELEEFGENTIKLTGVPNVCIDLDTKELFLESLDEINTVARTAKQEIEEKFISTVACKAAVKAKMALTFEEVDSLMQKLLVLKNPFTCPHGRPTAIKLSEYEIEKKFSRK